MKNINILVISLIILTSGCCNKPLKDSAIVDYDFISKWQSLNNSNGLVEFTDSSYKLYRNQELFFEFEYEIEHSKDDWYNMKFYEKDTKVKSKPDLASIQVVSQNRIRIIFWKHHDILDVADEFYRTDSLDDFENIMKGILKDD